MTCRSDRVVESGSLILQTMQKGRKCSYIAQGPGSSCTSEGREALQEGGESQDEGPEEIRYTTLKAGKQFSVLPFLITLF